MDLIEIILFIVEKILKGSLDLIPSPSVQIQIMGGKVCLRCKVKNIAGWCEQNFDNKKFVDITQHSFALLSQVNYPANDLKGDGI